MIVSILDIQAPIHLPDVVAVAEQTGYRRYWVAEHYSAIQSASPTLATALAAGVSERLRVGMAGVLLRMHAPLRVAADVGLLRSFFPGRIDVGIAGAAPFDVAQAMSGGIADDALYRARIEELIGLLSDRRAPCASFVDDTPEVWLCGTSVASARIAGELGIHYAYHHQIAPSRRDGVDVGGAYRDAFRPSPFAAQPYYATACYGAIAADDASATGMWRARLGDDTEPSFCGTAGRAADQLVALQQWLGADEMIVDCFAPHLEDRLAGLRGLAEALGLGHDSAVSVGDTMSIAAE